MFWLDRAFAHTHILQIFYSCPFPQGCQNSSGTINLPRQRVIFDMVPNLKCQYQHHLLIYCLTQKSSYSYQGTLKCFDRQQVDNNIEDLNLSPSTSISDKRKKSLLWKQERNSSGMRVSIWDKRQPIFNSSLPTASLYDCNQERPSQRGVDISHQKPNRSYYEGESLVSPTPYTPNLQNRDRSSCPLLLQSSQAVYISYFKVSVD